MQQKEHNRPFVVQFLYLYKSTKFFCFSQQLANVNGVAIFVQKSTFYKE